MSSSDKLEALSQLSQDFPKYSAAIARKVDISAGILEAVPDMFMKGPPSLGVYINGKLHTTSDLDAYSYVDRDLSCGTRLPDILRMLKHIRIERNQALSLVNLGITPHQALQLISDPLIGQSQTEDEPGDGIVDASDRPEGGGVIIWWNDIEKDSR